MKHKDYYDDQYIQEFSKKLSLAMPYFDSEIFSHSLIGQLDDKELFARFDCIVDAMQQSMGATIPKTFKHFLMCLAQN